MCVSVGFNRMISTSKHIRTFEYIDGISLHKTASGVQGRDLS